MEDTCSYTIELRGVVDFSDVNALSPLPLQLLEAASTSTRLRFFTDQAGLIGMMRRLHGLGFVFLSLRREEDTLTEYL